MQVPVQEDQRKRLPLKKSILQMNCLTIHFHQLKLLANNMNVHAETGRRRLKKANFMCARPCKRPLLTPLHIEQRLAWAHSVERLYQAQWDSDESRFKVNFVDWRIRIWRKKIEEYPYLKFITTFTYSMRRRVRAFIQAEGLRLTLRTATHCRKKQLVNRTIFE